jgi:hypothetical protein
MRAMAAIRFDNHDDLYHPCKPHTSNIKLTFIPCSSSINRQREPPHSERDITSLTLRAVVVERLPSTSKRRHALPAHTPQRRWETTTGVRRQRDVVLPELDVWATWRPWPGDSRMDSEREPKQRSSPNRLITVLFKKWTAAQLRCTLLQWNDFL